MNITNKQLAPTHRWHCCLGCKCGKILEQSEQKAEEEVHRVATPIIMCPPPPVIRPICSRADIPDILERPRLDRVKAFAELNLHSKNDSD